jgi:acetolactate synthase I/II/III large subunit
MRGLPDRYGPGQNQSEAENSPGIDHRRWSRLGDGRRGARVRTYEALAAACRRHGVEVAFGLVGDGNVKFVHHLTASLGVRYVAVRHESAAITMASGYARAGDRTAFATVTQGPGLTNALTALTAAAKARLPMVVFAGLPPTGLPGHPQTIDQQALLAVAGVLHQPLRPESIEADVATAFARAAAQRRPVGMFLATDVQDAPQPPGAGAGATNGQVVDPSPSPRPTGPIDAVAERLAAAERPVVIAGRGCLASEGARDRLIELADRCGALLATTLPIRGYFQDHPYAIGVLGGYATDLAIGEAEQADLIITFGASLNYRATRSGQLFRQDATIVQVDIDPTPQGASVGVDLALTGDAAAVAAALSSELAARPSRSIARTPALAERLRDGDVHGAYVDDSPDDRFHPRAFVEALDAMLPRERSVTVDGGHSSGFPSIYLDVPDRQGYLFALEFAAIGLGLGTAMGAAVARPDRLSVLVVGDGSLLMSLPDIETAAREGIPLLIVVMNDHAYTSELAILANDGLPPDLGLLPTPNLAALAEAMGATGLTVRHPDDLRELSAALADLRGPLVIDAQIDPTVRGPWLKGAFNRSLAVRS